MHRLNKLRASHLRTIITLNVIVTPWLTVNTPIFSDIERTGHRAARRSCQVAVPRLRGIDGRWRERWPGTPQTSLLTSWPGPPPAAVLSLQSSSVRSRHSDYHYRRDDYAERRPRDDFRVPTRRPFRGRGFAPRRGTGYVSRGGPGRRPYDGADSR